MEPAADGSITRQQCITLLFVLALALPGMARAQDRGVGLGVLLGEPTGFAAKWWETHTSALDFGAAWSLADEGAFRLHADWLWNAYGWLEMEEGRLPLYVGFGFRFVFRDIDPTSNDMQFGVRFPLGIDFMARRKRFDVFAEIVPVLQLTPDTDFDLDGGVGIRYWFRQGL